MSTEAEPTHTTPVSTDAVVPCGPLHVGEVVAGRYEVTCLLGRGKLGWVFEASDGGERGAGPHRRVALKVLRSLPVDAADEAACHARAVSELDCLRLVHAVAPTRHVLRGLAGSPVQHRAWPVLILELVEGSTVRALVDGGATFDAGRILRVGLGVARGLSALHAAGLVHQDLKPENVCLDVEGEAVLVDLGSARRIASVPTSPVGFTPRYAAPEQCHGEAATPATDVHALGLLLHELLTGQAPALGEPLRGRLSSASSVPSAFTELIRRCLEVDPAERPTAEEVVANLAAISPHRRDRARASLRPRLALLSAGMLLLPVGRAASVEGFPLGGPSSVSAASTTPTGWHEEAPVVASRAWLGEPLCTRRFGDGSEKGLSSLVAADGAGNPWMVGTFRGTVDLGKGPLSSAGGADLLLARFDQGCRTVWSRRFGDEDFQAATAIVYGGEGGMLVAGEFLGRLDFGDGIALENRGDVDAFLVRFDAEGRALWGKQYGDAAVQKGFQLAVGADGTVVAVNVFQGSIDYGNGTGTLTSRGQGDISMAKLGRDGEALWSVQLGDHAHQFPMRVRLDGRGNILLAGIFDQPFWLGRQQLVSQGGQDVFVAKFDGEGHLLWARSFGGPSNDDGMMEVNEAGDVLVIVNAHDVTEGDESAVGSARAARGPAGGRALSLAGLDAEGRTRWTRRFGGLEEDYGALPVAVGNEFHFTGFFGDPSRNGEKPSASGQQVQHFAARLDMRGGITWTQDFARDELRRSLTIGALGREGLFLTGRVGHSPFGLLTPQVGDDVYLTKVAFADVGDRSEGRDATR
ncbi:serine/threonine-protein kinase [Chondromyces crocatus]|uniref:Protein kinase domain-containing protein n=1 Tax=Chondromyces crocatus TaxID=52 RepID=A0A0K1EMI8_CHOCO|nr:serine/threonine-protein kinase [Chondromyces crocatus]AKT42064.1 uncharacterized protein CMC5_062870 [Chondromyces crocatus]